MATSKENLMHQLQQVGFTLVDLGEYMDTHPDDEFAIRRYNQAAEAYRALKAEYAENYGPLSLGCENSSDDEWLWATPDFPWDM